MCICKLIAVSYQSQSQFPPERTNEMIRVAIQSLFYRLFVQFIESSKVSKLAIVSLLNTER